MLKPDFDIPASTIREWVNERVEARFQKVSELIIVDDLPRNAAGKTVKNELKDRYLADKKTK